MGKAKRKRALKKAAKENPTGIISMKTAVDIAQENNYNQTTTEMLITKMQHIDARERECACATLSTISKNRKNCEKVISVDLLQTLSSLILDTLPRIQETATGALRNIMSCLGESHCHMIAKADVLTPVISFLANASKLDDISKCKGVIIQALNVLLSACEFDVLSSAIAQREKIASRLISFIKMKQSNEIAVAAAEVFNVLSEDVACFHSEDLQALESSLDDCDVTDTSQLLLAVMISSCLYNLHTLSPAEHRHALMSKIIDMFMKAVNRDAEKLVKETKHAIESSIKTEDDVQLFNQRKLSLSDECVVSVAISKADDLLRAQQIAMETLTNICCPATDDCHDDSGSSVATDEDDDEMVNEKLSQLMAPLSIACEVQTCLVDKHAPKYVLERTCFYANETYSCDNHDDKFTHIIKRSLMVQSRALTCVQNMLAVLDPQQIGNKDVMLHLMHTFVGLLKRANDFQFIESTGEEFHEGLTGCFRALSQIFITQKIYEVLPGHVLCRLREIATACDATMTKTNVVSLFGKVGIALSRKKFSEAVVNELVGIGNFLLDTAQGSDDVMQLPVVAEAIDSLLDVFSAGKSAQVASKQILLSERLRAIEPVFAMKVSEAKQTTDDYDVMQNIHLNLARFIKYLKKQQNKKY